MAIETAIRAGSFQAGERLPPQQMLTDFLGLRVKTVNRAFRETRQRGLTSHPPQSQRLATARTTLSGDRSQTTGRRVRPGRHHKHA
ncbi:GntR family transcriptional regulator [Paraburkholderia sediminicola]